MTQFASAPDAQVIADRGYCHVRGIEPVGSKGGALLVRLNPQVLPLFTPHGRRRPWLRRLASLGTAGQLGEWPAPGHGSTRGIAGRLGASHNTEEASKRADKQLRRRASKKGEVLQADPLEDAKSGLVVTPFDPITFSVAAVLPWERLRGQVALVFTRLKSLAALGPLPKSADQSARAGVYGNLFVALLPAHLIRRGQTLSPCRPAQSSPPPADTLAGVCVRSAANPAGYRTRSPLTVGPPRREQDCPGVS